MAPIYTLFLYFSFFSRFYAPIYETTFVNENGNSAYHPFFVSVTEIKENSKEKILEVSCRIFTDDFEKELRNKFNTHVDLLNASEEAGMGKLIDKYIREHLKIFVDGKASSLQYVGFERDEEAVDCYFQVDNTIVNKTVSVSNNILFDYKPEEINIVHVTVKGNRKSTQLINPESKVTFNF